MNDKRGIDLRVEHFRTQIVNVINESNIPPSIAFFVLKDVIKEVETLYTNATELQYQQFCTEAEKERLEKQKTKEEEENSSSSND